MANEPARTTEMVRAPISQVLVPHDGTEISDRALDKAEEFAEWFKSEIIILHIVDYKIRTAECYSGIYK